MGIRERGYRHWEGGYTSHGGRWWTVAKQAMRATTHNKLRLVGLLLFMFMVWAPYFFFGLFWFIAGASELPLRGTEGSDRFLRDNLYDLVRGWQVLIFPIFVAMVASPFVSNDLRSNALYIYLSKPMRRWDYVMGKAAAALILAVPVTLLPNVFVWLMAIGSTDESTKLNEPWEILGEILAIQAVFLLVLAFVTLAASSLTKRWWVAFGGFMGAYFILHIVSNILQDVIRKRDWILSSLSTNLINYAKTVFERPRGPPSWEVSLTILIVLVVGAFVVFLWRILRLEVAE